MPYRLLFDTESDGFVAQATKVHCVVAIDVDTGETLDWKPDQIDGAVEALDKADTLIGHNIQRHDIPLLTKIKLWVPKPDVTIRDTMIGARLKHPNIRETDAELVASGKMPSKGHDGKSLMGRHTLEAWGVRLGEHKTAYDGGWEAWSQVMHDYMMQDGKTNLRLWYHLDLDNYPIDAVELEHRIARVCDAMEKAGVPFDKEAAGKLHAELIGRKAELEAKLISQFGSWLAPREASASKQTFTPKVNNAKLGYVKGQQCCKLKKVTFNPGSRDHIAKLLADRGWIAKEFTAGGKPEINENIAAGLAQQFPEFDGIADYLMVDKRLSQLAGGKQAWLNFVGDDGCIHGVINPMGTVTSRASHFNPNISQVPASKKPYGHECRALFRAPPGWNFVGADQEGLELRGLAHYLSKHDGGKYALAVTKGDPHWLHAQVLELVQGPRDKENKLHLIVREDGSKRFIYAYIYGCGDVKAGEIIFAALNRVRLECGEGGKKLYVSFFGKTLSPGDAGMRKVGKKIRQSFLNRLTGFKALKKKLKTQVDKRARVPGLDGRRIPTRSEHSALNFLIQSCGAILCKRWVCDAFDEISAKYKHGWDGQFVFCIWNHDEIQVAVREGLEEEIGQIIVKCARAAGEPYGFRVPLDSKYIVGKTWAETH